MKITFVIQKLTGLTGGAERVLIDTAIAMQARGFEVQIATFEARKGAPGFSTGGIPVINLFPFARSFAPPAEEQSSKNSQRKPGSRAVLEQFVKRLPNVFPLTEIKWQMTHGFFIRRLRRYIVRERPQVLIPFMPPAITACAYAAQGTDTRVVASTHNVPERDFGNSARWDQNPAYRRRSIEALALVDHILVLLPEFRHWFPAALHERIHIMPNPIRRLSLPPENSISRTQTVLGVGRLTEIKRFDLLIRAWSQLAPRFPDWHLRILGDGPERAKLQALIDALGLSKRIDLTGFTSDMAGEYDRAMILCHPSEFEGFGLAVAEAMAHGLPAIGFDDCPGVNSLIDSGRNGLLVDSATSRVEGLAGALESLMADPKERTRMANEALSITEDYAPKRIYDTWEDLLRSTQVT